MVFDYQTLTIQIIPATMKMTNYQEGSYFKNSLR